MDEREIRKVIRNPRDQDGSAKIVFIGVDRSILAWVALSLHELKFAEAAMSAIMTLNRLRVATEKHFPKARPLIRRGFDTHRFGGKK